MPNTPPEAESHCPAVETYLLGQIELRRCLQLQQQLVRQIGDRDDGQIALLLCEHPPVITVGRAGSPVEVASQSRMVQNGQIEVHWVNRGGPCMVHCPGQLAIYPIVPLRWHGFSVGEYIERLQAGIIEALDDLSIRGRTPPGKFGVWGRTGQLAGIGVAVRGGVTYFGAYLNVNPAMGLFRLVENDPLREDRASCLMAERRSNARMPKVRAALVQRMADALGCDRYHLYTGHPLLRKSMGVE